MVSGKVSTADTCISLRSMHGGDGGIYAVLPFWTLAGRHVKVPGFTKTKCLPGFQTSKRRVNTIHFKRKILWQDFWPMFTKQWCLKSQKNFAWIFISLGFSKCLLWDSSTTCADRNPPNAQQIQAEEETVVSQTPSSLLPCRNSHSREHFLFPKALYFGVLQLTFKYLPRHSEP